MLMQVSYNTFEDPSLPDESLAGWFYDRAQNRKVANPEGAIADYRALLSLKYSGGRADAARIELALILVLQKRYSEALPYLNAALRSDLRDPLRWRALLIRAEIYGVLKMYREAQADYQTMLGLSGIDGSDRFAVISFISGRKWRELLASDQLSEPAAAVLQHNWETRFRVEMDVLRRNTDNEHITGLATKALADLTEQLEQVIAKSSDPEERAQALMYRARMLLDRKDDVVNAIGDLESAANIPGCRLLLRHEALLLCALLEAERGGHEAAVKHLGAVIEETKPDDPDKERALYQRSVSLVALGRLEESDADLQALIQLRPGDNYFTCRALNKLGRNALARGDAASALRDFTRAAAGKSLSHDILVESALGMALVALQSGDCDRSLELVRQAREWERTHPAVRAEADLVEAAVMIMHARAQTGVKE